MSGVLEGTVTVSKSILNWCC